MRSVPAWTLLTAACAPVLLIAGWTTAAALEGPAYDPVRQTISVLGAYGAAGFWVMTGTFLALGVCYLLTAWGLRPAALPGRVALAGGGVAALAMVLVPAPSSGGSLRHGAVAAFGFGMLAVWPLLAVRPGGAAPWGLRVGPSVAVTVLVVLGACWYVYETNRAGAAGVAERLVTCLQSCWPLVVVASCLHHGAGPRRDAAPRGRGRERAPRG
ncbi:DUF998 domain-containing protein [Streptomyces sp. NPDC003327]